MRSFYGKDCPKHPELAGRRYLPNGSCVECQRKLNREGNKRRKKEADAREKQRVQMEELLRACVANKESFAFETKLLVRIEEVLGKCQP